MENDYGGNQLVKNPSTGQWSYADGGGQDEGGIVFTPTPNPVSPYDKSGTLSFGGFTIGSRDMSGTDHYLPSTMLDMMFGGGGGGRSWLPGEYELKQQDLDMMQQHYDITDALAALQEDRLRLENDWRRAVEEGNLALMRDAEARMAANDAQTQAYNQQKLAIDSAIGQAQVGANVYGTQTQGRSSQLATMADLTKAAAEAQANPWNPLGYLDFVAGEGGGTPYSNMTPEQTTGYGNQMAQNWQNTFGPVAGQLNRSIEATYQTPDAITAALQQAQPWYMGSTNYNAASPNQQAIFKGLQPAQQMFLAQATPEQLRYIANPPQAPVNPALARYQRSTQGEKAALARATPEELRRLWEAGQVA